MNKSITIPIIEYERLKRAGTIEPKLCLGMECDYQKEHNKKQWSFAHFKIALSRIITSPEFYVFLIFVVLFILFAPKDVIGSWICLAVVAICFMFYKQIGGLINRGNLNVNANVGAQIGANNNEIRG